MDELHILTEDDIRALAKIMWERKPPPVIVLPASEWNRWREADPGIEGYGPVSG